MTDLILTLGKANLAAAAAILAVILIRRPARHAFGARQAYRLWLLVPLAAAAVFIPARTLLIPLAPLAAPTLSLDLPDEADGPAAQVPAVVSSVSSPSFALDPMIVLSALWIIGMLATAAWLLRKQSKFHADERNGRAGPAVVGVVRPRIVTPANFAEVFSERERAVILAHENTHLVRHDPRANGIVALIQCVCWFNPLVHIAAYLLRIDQELACDAQVMERHPNTRRTYAEALLKAELSGSPPPLGCYWPPDTQHPLTERVAMLKRNAPGRARRIVGAGSLIILAASAGLAAWAAQPQRIVYVEAPQPVTAPQRADIPVSQLTIVAVKRGLLEVRSARGEIYVRRVFEPGEFYVPRMGAGWTATTDDGAAFEWRLGARSLGLMAKGGPVYEQSVDAAALRPAETPQRIPSSPEQTPPPQTPQATQKLPIQAPFPGWNTPTSNDNWVPVAISGTITSVKWVNPSTQIFVHGDDGKDWYILSSTPNTMLRLGGTTSIITKDVRIAATGQQDLSIACAPLCVAMARAEDLTFDGKKLQPVSGPPPTGQPKPEPVLFQAPAPATQPAASHPSFPPTSPWDGIDGNSPVFIEGVITSIEWKNPSTMLHVTDTAGKRWLASTATPNTFMRLGGTRENVTVNTKVTIQGFLPFDRSCNPECGVFADPRLMTFNGAKLMPVQAVQPLGVSPPLVDANGVPVFVPVYLMGQDKIDPNSPVAVTGTVTSVKWVNPSTQINVHGVDGKDYVIQTATPNSLLRAGFSKTNLKEGAGIAAQGHRENPPCAAQCAIFVGPDQITLGSAQAAPTAFTVPAPPVFAAPALAAPAPPPEASRPPTLAAPISTPSSTQGWGSKPATLREAIEQGKAWYVPELGGSAQDMMTALSNKTESEAKQGFWSGGAFTKENQIPAVVKRLTDASGGAKFTYLGELHGGRAILREEASGERTEITLLKDGTFSVAQLASQPASPAPIRFSPPNAPAAPSLPPKQQGAGSYQIHPQQDQLQSQPQIQFQQTPSGGEMPVARWVSGSEKMSTVVTAYQVRPRSNEDKQWDLTHVTFIATPTSGAAGPIIMTAREGLLDGVKRVLVLSGDVVVTYSDGRVERAQKYSVNVIDGSKHDSR